MGLATAELATLKERLRTDTPFYSSSVLKVINERGELVPLEARKPQLRLHETLRRQREAGQPMRAIVLKARQIGFSTWVQAAMFQNTTLNANRRSLIVAHNLKAAQKLFEISQTYYAYLPDDKELGLRPPIRSSQMARLLHFGSTVAQSQVHGGLGLNSSIQVDVATEAESGRGHTYHDLHLSEVAMWPQGSARDKLTTLLQTVHDEPGTMIVMESTAKGHNEFRRLWHMAESGDLDYAPVFFPWFDHPNYTRPFVSDSERERFQLRIGDGAYGEGEERLLDVHNVSLEQLNWRQWAIRNRCQGDLRIFWQEFPSEPEEAFVSSAEKAFSAQLLVTVKEAVKFSDPEIPSAQQPGPMIGVIKPDRTRTHAGAHGKIEVPVEPRFLPGKGEWRVFSHPEPGNEDEERPPGQYVVGVDVSGGEYSDDSNDPSYHAIQVIDHRSREQVAEYRSREDEHLLARVAYLAATYYNEAWMAIETTGGWGLPVARIVWQDFRYPFSYFRPSIDRHMDKQQDRLGWHTDRKTKPILVAEAREMLREGTHGINSRLLLNEMFAYQRDERGRTEPAPGAHADLLMAWMIAQVVATEKQLRPIIGAGTSTRNYSTRNRKVAA